MIRRVYCSIVLPFKTRKKVKRLCGQLLRMSRTKQVHNPLHVSIRTSFYTNRLEEYRKGLKAFAKNHKPFSLKTTGHVVFSKRCLVLKVNKPKPLCKLEKDLIQFSQGYVSGSINKNREKPPVSGKKERYLKKYGDPFIFEFYNPHITLVYNISKGQKDILSFLNKKKPKFSFKVTHLNVVEKTDKYRILYHIPLGNK